MSKLPNFSPLSGVQDHNTRVLLEQLILAVRTLSGEVGNAKALTAPEVRAMLLNEYGLTSNK